MAASGFRALPAAGILRRARCPAARSAPIAATAALYRRDGVPAEIRRRRPAMRMLLATTFAREDPVSTLVAEVRGRSLVAKLRRRSLIPPVAAAPFLREDSGIARQLVAAVV